MPSPSHPSTTSRALHDVELHIAQDKIICIHSSTLRQCSGFFSSSLNWAEAGGSSPPIIYELDLADDVDYDIFRKQTDNSKLEISAESPPGRDESYYRALFNLFDIFQHRSPSIAGLDDIIILIKLADKYDSLPTVSRAVRLHLMEAGGQPSSLYRDIAADPVRYLHVGEKLRSSSITKEAATHVLGTWSQSREECRSILSETFFGTLVQRHHELSEKKWAANKQLLSLNLNPPRPTFVQNPLEDGAVIALARVRELISLAFSRCYQGSDYENLEGEMYREVAQSTAITYTLTPKVARAAITFDSARSHLQAKIALALGDLAEVHLQLQSEVLPGHITSAQLKDSDLPWDGDWI
ncbi:uncharacterized protein BP5553_00458 [Venustampulla echinocandica]|uniref:BTB domain-containing protein n=1 Tax=Venustampulla echinocandica TaxID=2656787 RepID=A0A370TY77_9HELO|nr:uncharacterized protein BP5553_00458 [Venustampulla echinocandica]RDL40479.1 hypothetical protein BP5553_00458 [Venustampulla echinocandica]